MAAKHQPGERRADTIQRIWSALRIQKRNIEIPTLAMIARAPESSTADYVRILIRSGYLSITARARPGRVNAHRLERDTGPLAPRRAITVMYDHNTHEVFELPIRRNTRRTAKRREITSFAGEQFRSAA